MHTPSREANLLGVLSLMVSDRVRESVLSGQQRHESLVAAQIATCTFLAGGTIEALSVTLGLSHSATVRVVDALEEQGIVERREASDRRAIAVEPTRRGRRLTRVLLRERERVLDDILAPLTAPERRIMTALHERVLFALVAGGAVPQRVCRMCDMRACGHDDGACPVTNGAQGRRLTEIQDR